MQTVLIRRYARSFFLVLFVLLAAAAAVGILEGFAERIGFRASGDAVQDSYGRLRSPQNDSCAVRFEIDIGWTN
jgi:hypothetical protein